MKAALLRRAKVPEKARTKSRVVLFVVIDLASAVTVCNDAPGLRDLGIYSGKM